MLSFAQEITKMFKMYNTSLYCLIKNNVKEEFTLNVISRLEDTNMTSISKFLYLLKNNSWLESSLTGIIFIALLLLCINLYSKLKFYRKQVQSKEIELRIMKYKLKSIKKYVTTVEDAESFVLNHHHLNTRQKQVANLILKGYTNNEIGEKLFISPNTVKYHVKNIFTAFKVKSRNEMFTRFEFEKEFDEIKFSRSELETLR